MIVDYKLNSKHMPSTRDVWLMSRKAEDDGHVITKALIRAMDSGDIKYHDGVFYRLCRHCMDYLPIDQFHENKRYIMEVNYICKSCSATRRRIKQYATPHYVSDVGMFEEASNVSFYLKPGNKEVILERISKADKGGDEE